MSKRVAISSAMTTSLLLVVGLGGGCRSAAGDPEPFNAPSSDASADVVDASTELDATNEPEADAPFFDPDTGEKDAPEVLVEPPCDNDNLDGDEDGDGWSVAQGDCNDCTELMNPGALDIPGGVDEDCNGTPDDEPFGCDEGLAVEGNDPMDAARALGLCRIADPDAPMATKSWGLLSAKYVFVDGSATSGTPKFFGTDCMGDGNQGTPPNSLSRGILPQFGNATTPMGGASMLALSTGVARSGVNGMSPAGAHMCTKSGTPSGFPTPSEAACPGQNIDTDTTAYDSIALEIQIRTPTNAQSFSFDFNFFTYEYPNYICSQYNDFFVALMWPVTAANVLHNNICFDTQGNPVSVNNGFLEVCPPGTHGGKVFDCPLGIGELAGTGFEGRGANWWLRTSAPIEPGETITLRFGVWDMGDDAYDSTVLLDNVVWDTGDLQLPPFTDRPPK